MSERSSIRPKFRKDLIVSDYHGFGGMDYIILHDPVSAKYFKMSRYEYDFLKTLDGTRTLAQAIQILKSQGRFYPEQDAMEIAEKAANGGLLLGVSHTLAQNILQKKAGLAKSGRIRALTNLYFVYFPLINPDKFLERTVWIFKPFVNKVSLFILLALSCSALYLVISSFSRISHNYLYFFNFNNLLILWLGIVITKLIHELAHAYTAKYFGLRVPRMGVAFLVFMPCLYCDTTDAWRLARPGHRIAISAAGVLSEIIIAVAGAHVWYFSKPGLLNSVAFYLMVVSLTSTIFINGNPLIKLDGYFVLIDWLKLPNLASKSTSYLKYLFMNRTLGIERIANPALDARERAIFAIYGIAKTIYRLFLYTAIICAVYYKFDKTLGLALAITAFALFMVLPLIRGITTLYRARSSISPRFRGALACLSIMGALIMFLFIPWSAKSSYPCYLESSRTIKITTPLDVAIREVWIRKGDIVKKGEPMFRLDPVELELELSKRIIERKILENEIILMKLSEKERSLAPIRELEFKRISMETRKLIKERQIAASGAMAPFRGVVTKLDKEMQPGARPGKGSVMGELKSLEDLRIYALIPENDIHRITKGQPVTIYFPASDKKTHKGKVEMIRRFNERDLRDSTFSSARGGPIATEKSSEEGAERPLTSHYICSTSLNDSEGPPLGATGLFIVTSKPVSVMGRLYGSIVRTFNRESLI